MKIGIRQSEIENLLEGFALHLSEKEPAVFTHKINYRIKLLVDKTSLVADYRNADNRNALAVLVVDFRDRDVESALEPPYDALDNAPLSLEARHALQR